MSISTAIVFSLSVTCFSMFYLSNTIEIPIKIKGFTYYFNVILKMFFMQVGIILIPTVMSMCNFLLTDMGTMPSTLRMIDKLTGITWMIYYIYFAFYAITMIYYAITAATNATSDGEQ